MNKETRIFEEGLEEYPKAGMILGHLVMIIWIALGTIASWFLAPLAAWIYLAVAIVIVYIVLRKLVCTNCYYHDKWCGMGWGKLSALFFKKGNMEKFDTSIGIKLAPITYGLLSLIPIICIVISIVQGFIVFKIIVLLLLLLVSAYSGFFSRKKGCANCKMRLACPGSAAK